MKILNKYKILNIVTVFTVAMFFSCKDNFDAVKDFGMSENEPIGVAEGLAGIKYTDSTRVQANLVSPKMLDYSNRDFSFYEFPEGVTLDIFDKNKNKTIIVSDYAIVYNKTDLIDLQGNVVITRHDGNVLKTEQLYFDQNKKWLFTNNPFTFEKGEDYLLKGVGFDTNTDTEFIKLEALEVGDSDSFVAVDE